MNKRSYYFPVSIFEQLSRPKQQGHCRKLDTYASIKTCNRFIPYSMRLQTILYNYYTRIHNNRNRFLHAWPRDRSCALLPFKQFHVTLKIILIIVLLLCASVTIFGSMRKAMFKQPNNLHCRPSSYTRFLQCQYKHQQLKFRSNTRWIRVYPVSILDWIQFVLTGYNELATNVFWLYFCRFKGYKETLRKFCLGLEAN